MDLGVGFVGDFDDGVFPFTDFPFGVLEFGVLEFGFLEFGVVEFEVFKVAVFVFGSGVFPGADLFGVAARVDVVVVVVAAAEATWASVAAASGTGPSKDEVKNEKSLLASRNEPKPAPDSALLALKLYALFVA